MSTKIFTTPTRPVLVPTDFSPGGDEAYRHALAMALHWKVPVDLAHAEPDNTQVLPHTFPNAVGTLVRWGRLSEGATEADAARLGVSVRRVVRPGTSVVQAMEAELEEIPPDMIVLGHHHRKGIDRLLAPPVANPLTQRSHTPTLVIPDGATGFVESDGSLRLRRILVPVAPEPDPQAAVDSAAAFLRSLHVEGPMFATLYAGWPQDRPKVALPVDPGWQLTSWVGAESPAEEIVTTAASWLADLVVMVSQGRVGLLDTLRGSTVEQVLSRISCPVLIIPEL